MLRSLYLWACERLYHEFAGGYDVISRLVSAGAWSAWRRSVLPHIKGARLLEIGFGTGELLAELAEVQETRRVQTNLQAPGELRPSSAAACGWAGVTGLELSPEMHVVAARHLANGGLFVPRVQAPAGAMPFRDASFDTVVSTFPAPYILDPVTLAECARVLQPGGRLVVAGLWVRLHDERLRRALPVFYADPPAAYYEEITRRVEHAGFHATWHHEPTGWAEVPVLIGELP
jgi:ubiquinone/menaquinone biosynthesis C-methylase UbiE